MQKLIKLEMKKHKILGYWKGILLTNLAITAFVVLITFTSKTTEENIAAGSDFPLMNLNHNLLYATFIIFSAVVLARVVIEEYRNKTIQVLFTYPIARKKFMQAKLILVFSFSLVSVLFSSIFQYIAFSIINPLLDLSSESITLGMMMNHLPELLLSAFAVASVGLISLFFGMLQKSTVATITSSVVSASLLTSGSGDSNGGNLFQFAGVQIALSLLGIGIALLSYRKINQSDIL